MQQLKQATGPVLVHPFLADKQHVAQAWPHGVGVMMRVGLKQQLFSRSMGFGCGAVTLQRAGGAATLRRCQQLGDAVTLLMPKRRCGAAVASILRCCRLPRFAAVLSTLRRCAAGAALWAVRRCDAGRSDAVTLLALRRCRHRGWHTVLTRYIVYI